MRSLPLLSIVFLSVATHAFAQVTLDLHALQALPERGGGKAPMRATPSPVPHQAGRTETTGPRSAARSASPVAEPAAKGSRSDTASEPAPSPGTGPSPASSPVVAAAQPDLPQTVPPTAMITPVGPSPPATSAPPPPAASSPGTSSAAPTGIRVSFAPGQSDLGPESVAALKQLVAATAKDSAASFNVMAYAPGSSDDPSTARRMSLSRAMAVRSALVADGVASAQIYVRALGEQYGAGPPDRADVSIVGVGGGGAAAQATPR